MIAASLTALGATSAPAAGFAVREQSAEGLGASFAGVAAGLDGLSSKFWNPATVTLHEGFKQSIDIVSASASVAW